MIEVGKLSKIYPGGEPALHDVTFTLHTGMIGLVGPNGAGKTTLMRILATLLHPTSGSVNLFTYTLQTERHRRRIRDMLGYLPQESSLHPRLSVEQNLNYFAVLKRMDDLPQRSREIDRILEQTGLTEVRHERADTLSVGMNRRLGVAITLLNRPRLIMVDEPAVGLDPAERVRFRKVLAELNGERIVILASHVIQDVEPLSSRLLILERGQLIFDGRPADLIEQARGHVWMVEPSSASQLPGDDRLLLATITRHGKPIQRVITDLPPTSDARPDTPSLEDAYLYTLHRSRRSRIDG
ncbi:MAG: ATP-binding cassette domain-containing protein [Anaerolineae bacterium]|nr:ATP-binding cassette domain-containing protein [Anaerolineae bacterium]